MQHLALRARVSSALLARRPLPGGVRKISSRSTTSCSSSSAQSSGPTYQGAYGAFQIGPDDEREVLLYRLGINIAAAATVASSVTTVLPPDARAAVAPYLDVIAVTGMAGLGMSLQQIHIYVDPLKKFLQALWALGLLGSLGIMAMQDDPAAVYVVSHPVAIWLVGPLFAALTGVAFKEGFCYNKWEAAGLFGTTPLMLLGHLFGVLPQDVEQGMLAAFTVLITVFALRKWTQPTKDDVGDKSVFELLQLPEEQRNARMLARQQQQQQQQ